MFYHRNLYSDITNVINSRQAIVITGLRRTGKTTIVKELLKNINNSNKIFIDLEKFSHRELFSEKNYDNIVKAFVNRNELDASKKMYIAIDEFQLLPNITSVIKYLYDHYDIKFFLTGSSSFYIKNLFRQSLAGRKIIFELDTLTFGEYLGFKQGNINPKTESLFTFDKYIYEERKLLYEDYLNWGGFPEVVLTEDVILKKSILEDIINSYISIDIKYFSDFRKQTDIYRLIKLLTARTGSKIDYVKLSILSGMSRASVKNYVELFEDTFLIKRINALSKNIDRQVAKSPKLYFCDNGILNIMSELSTGVKFENGIYNQLKHRGEISYYLDKYSNEIDFIVDKKTAYEAKISSVKRDYKRLERISETLKLKPGAVIVKNPPTDYKEFIWGGDIL